MRRRWLCMLAATAAPIIAFTLPSAPAQATPGVPVFPGMEVRQGTNVCTLGYVDPQMRIAFTAGHCRGNGQVTDRDGNLIGTQTLFRDNTPNGATVDTNHQIADWEAISLSPEVAINNVLPGGRQLVADPAIVAVAGLPVCHFGVVTGETCGTIQAVYNGWFTMANGVVSQKGDWAARSTTSPPTAGRRSSECSTAPGANTLRRCRGRPPVNRCVRTSSLPLLAVWRRRLPSRGQPLCPSGEVRKPGLTVRQTVFHRRSTAGSNRQCDP